MILNVRLAISRLQGGRRVMTSTNSWRRWATVALVAAALTGVAAACTPAASPGAPSQTAPARPNASETDPSAEWEQIVAAARREGRVALNGPPTSEAREALVEGFQRQYPEIQVDYTGSAGSAVPPKLFAERDAGQFRVDLIVNGTTTQLDLVQGNALDPIAPYLVGPNARDTSRWQGGKLDFVDSAQTYNVVYGNTVKTPFAYHPGQVSPDEIRSFKDLLNPRWKGRMAMYDPRSAGSGLSLATFWYTHDELGREFIRQLLAQNLVFSRDDRQLLDWVVRGQYAIAIAPAERMMTEFRSKGVPVHLIGGESVREGTYLAAGTSSVGVVNRPPHPNALRVYLDYLLSREGQLEWSKGVGFASRRTDVPTDHLPDYVIPKAGVRYQESWKEEYVDLRDEVMDLLRAYTGS
jgi:iron(III) transport system substrate-binding protein